MQYSEQELRRMRERAIQGAYDMQRRSAFPQQRMQPTPQQMAPAASPAPETRPPQQQAQPQRNAPQHTPQPPQPVHTQASVQTKAPTQTQAHMQAQTQTHTPRQNRQSQFFQAARAVETVERDAPPRPSAKPPAQPCTACPVGRLFGDKACVGGGDDKDQMLILFLVILLMQEGADQTMLFTLLYIIM